MQVKFGRIPGMSKLIDGFEVYLLFGGAGTGKFCRLICWGFDGIGFMPHSGLMSEDNEKFGWAGKCGDICF